MVTDGVDLPPINPSYSPFTLESFDGMAFLTFAASKGQWTIYSDLVYVSFADTLEVGPLEVSWDLSGGTVEVSAGYRPASWEHTHLIFGLRGVEASVDASLTPGPVGGSSASFVDPIIGIYHQQTFANNWGVAMRGDIGGTSSELMVNAMLEGSYRFTDTFTATFGYRYLQIDFEDSDTLLDLSILGYFVGFQFDW